MTTFERTALSEVQASPAGTYPGTKLAGWLTTTDHKRIGALYLITSFSFFLLAGVLALIIRAGCVSRTCCRARDVPGRVRPRTYASAFSTGSWSGRVCRS